MLVQMDLITLNIAQYQTLGSDDSRDIADQSDIIDSNDSSESSDKRDGTGIGDSGDNNESWHITSCISCS